MGAESTKGGSVSPDFMSTRLRRKLEEDGWASESLEMIGAADFSNGQAPGDASWYRSNERIHAAVAIAARKLGLEPALALAQTDWRDVLVVAGLADEGWRRSLDDWLGTEPATPEG